MKAAICPKYGPPDVVQLVDIPKPTPKANEVLVRIDAASVSSGDARLRAFDFPVVFRLPMRLVLGVTGPRMKILGSQFAGVVEAVGASVTRFKVGDEVFGANGLKSRCHAQYVCIREKGVIEPMPANMTAEEAVTLPFGGMTALELLRKANIQPGQSVLINGAAGGVGTAAIQVARHLGAEVTAVCRAANNSLVTSLGAASAIDYTAEDVGAAGPVYDVVFDAVGKMEKAQGQRLLKPDGTWLSVTSITSETNEKLLALKEMAENGAYKAVIDKTYPLEQIVEAYRHVDAGHKRGNVVIAMSHDDAGSPS